MKIVISGSNGYAASNIISFFKRIGLDAETYAFDLEGVESYSRFDSADLFIHAGAISTNQTQSERLFELNCFKTAEYLHEWRSRSSKSSVFVFFSSHHVNVGLKTGFRTPYSASKQCAEEFISSIHRLGGNPGRRRSIIIRPGSYGVAKRLGNQTSGQCSGVFTTASYRSSF
jgi:nucleoside-diphosphate-sugar epimerase